MTTDRNDDLLPYIEDGTIVGAVAQKSHAESYLAVHLLHWLNTDAMKGHCQVDRVVLLG